MLEKEFQYFLEHQDELVEKYENKYLVIVDSEVIGSFDSEIKAYDHAIDKYDKGTFLIQYCTPGETSYTQIYHSRVVI